MKNNNKEQFAIKKIFDLIMKNNKKQFVIKKMFDLNAFETEKIKLFYDLLKKLEFGYIQYSKNNIRTYSTKSSKIYIEIRRMDISVHNNENLCEFQKKIFACLKTLNTNGYEREKYMRFLLEGDIEEYMLPFLMEISGDYVFEIVNAFYELRKNKDNHIFKKFAEDNIENYMPIYDRMVSYWNEYYKYEQTPIKRKETFTGKEYVYYSVKNYIGYKLFKEIWGFIPKRRLKK